MMRVMLERPFAKDDPGQSGVHVDAVMGAQKPFKLDKVKCASCGKRHGRGEPCFKFAKADFDETKHPRGQPQNKGEFASVPSAPGSTPIPKGEIRLWHYTNGDPAQVKREGLTVANARGHTYGEPDVVWASAGMPSDDMFQIKNMVEFHAPLDKLDIGAPAPGVNYGDEGPIGWLENRKANVTLRGDLDPKNIIAIHEPWHQTLRYLEENYGDDPQSAPKSEDFGGPGEESTQKALKAFEAAHATSKPFTPLSRSDMPQLGGKPTPGTKSSTLPVNVRGNVDLSEPFLDELKQRGVSVTDKWMDPKSLKPSQSEINPTTVDTLVNAKLPKGEVIKPLWISNDGHVIDGHHRWAADVLKGEKSINVREIDLPIQQALDEARSFAEQWGVKQESVGESNAGQQGKKDVPTTAVDQMIAHGGFSINPTTGGAPAGGYMVALQGHSSITTVKDKTPETKAMLKSVLIKYAKDNAKLFAENKHLYLGGWYDADHQEFVLDPSENVMDQDEAKSLGAERNQQAIWSVVDGREINTGGSGDREPEAGIVKDASERLRSGNRPMGRGVRGAGDGAGRDSGTVQFWRIVDGASYDSGDPASVESARYWRLAKAFNPDEARDDRGEWTSGGGSGDEDVPANETESERAGRLARQHLQEARTGSPSERRNGRKTKAMKDLVQRDGINTAADLQAGDVIRTAPRMNGVPGSLVTIEHATVLPAHHVPAREKGLMPARDAQDVPEYAHVTGRKPDGSMIDMNYRTDNANKGWEYVGSETPLKRFETTHTIQDHRDFVHVDGFPPHIKRQIDKAIELVEARTRAGALKDVRVVPSLELTALADTHSKPFLIRINRNLIQAEDDIKPASVKDTGDDWQEHQTLNNFGGNYTLDIESKFHPKRNGYSALTAVTTHELGHALHTRFLIEAQPSRRAAMERLYQKYSYSIFAARPDVSKSVSAYATKSFHEFTAEAFSEGILADRPRPMAKYVTKLLTDADNLTIGDEDDANQMWTASPADSKLY